MGSPQRQGAASAASEPVARSPERQRLADAIAAVDATRAECERIRAAVAMAEGIVSAANRDLTKAESDIEAAKVAMRDSITSAAMRGDAPPAGNVLREARLAEAEARDRLDAARDALAAIQAPLSDWELGLQERGESVTRARAAVVATVTAEALNGLEPLKRQVVGYALILSEIAAAGIDAPADDAAGQAVRRASLISGGILSTPMFSTVVSDMRRDGNHTAEWQRALEALRTDPDYSLPALP